MILLFSLFPSPDLALGLGERHWYGVGGGWTVGRETRPVGCIFGGGLWAGLFGMGGIFQFPLDAPEPGEPEFMAAATLDYFLYQGRTHLAVLGGATEYREPGSGDYEARFTAGVQLGWTVPLSPRWHFGMSATPLWEPGESDAFRTALSGEMQFRY